MSNDVVILTTSFPRWSGDFQGQFIFDVARLHAESGCQVELVAPHVKGVARHENMAGIKVNRFQYMVPASLERIAYGAGFIENIKRSWIAKLSLIFFLGSFFMASFLPARRAKVIHAHWPIAGLIALALGRLLGRKVVLTVHGVEVFQKKVSRLTKLCINRADSVICNSQPTLDRTLEVSSPKQIAVIRWGVQTPTANASTPPVGLPTPYVLSVGRLIPRKGIDVLLDAVPAILRRQSCHFVVAGDGPTREELIQKAHSLGISQHVTFPGAVSNEMLYSLYSNCAVFVHPVITTEDGDREGLGIVALEAMALGKPVVASAIGGLVDVVIDGHTGFLVPERDAAALSDKVISLLENPELAERLGGHAKERVALEFSQTKCAEETLAVYAELTKRRE